jgi:hypothetical protein
MESTERMPPADRRHPKRGGGKSQTSVLLTIGPQTETPRPRGGLGCTEWGFTWLNCEDPACGTGFQKRVED